MTIWCTNNNNLRFNTFKSKELIVDFRGYKPDIQPRVINGERVEMVPNFSFLDSCVYILRHLAQRMSVFALIKFMYVFLSGAPIDQCIEGL